MLSAISDLLGRFHPVLVHLPIGILLLACFFQILTVKDRFTVLQPAIPVMFFWGMISAVFSCITGLMLYNSGDYEGSLAERHQWMGIAVASASLILYILYQLSIGERPARIFSIVIIILVTITGHLGGSLTHGPDFLTEGLNSDAEIEMVMKPIPNIQEAHVYNDVIQPLLQARCYNCHGPNKQKGKLRLDEQQYILKGGKDGPVIDHVKADESELIERLMLPLSDEDHMPPKEKPQLTPSQISLLHWWISTGAPFDKKVKDLEQTERIKPALLFLQSGSGDPSAATTDLPAEHVAKADVKVLERLKDAGVMVIPVAQNSNYLSVSFVTATKGADSLVEALKPIARQIISLRLDDTDISDKSMEIISQFSNLRRLHLTRTAVTDQGIARLASLKDLHSLNLVGTKISANGLNSLGGLKNLKNLYLYQTGVLSTDMESLKKLFPATNIDSGNYKVPILPTDTTEAKLPG